MKFFGLAPESASGGGSSTHIPARTVTGSMLYGSLSFGLVSVLAYSIWAFRLVPGQAAMYSSIALVYIGVGGLVLSRLVDAPGAWRKFPLLFAIGFLVYAIGWCAFWFGLRGRYLADLWGAAVGLAGMAWLFQHAFGRRGGFLLLFLALFAWHSAGYYLGGELKSQVRGSTGMLLWGAAHGLGFGAGLGCLLFFCQRPAKV